MRYSRNARSERNSQRKTDRALCLVKQASQIKQPVGASPGPRFAHSLREGQKFTNSDREDSRQTKWRQRALRQKGSRMASKRFTDIASQFLIHFILKFEKSTTISQFSLRLY